MTLPVAKREIHNGHDLWAELLGILLSGPNLGMCSRNADWRPAGPFVPTGKGGGRGGGSMAGASLSGGGAVEEAQVTPVGGGGVGWEKAGRVGPALTACWN